MGKTNDTNETAKKIKIEIAKNMLKDSIQKISELTGLSVEEISSIDIKLPINYKDNNQALVKEKTQKSFRKSYTFEYKNEKEFKKYERSLKIYNMLAYKRLYFSYYPSLKEGKFLGEVVSSSDNKNDYQLKLPTDIMFTKVHGEVILHYSVYINDKIVVLDKITPEGILGEGHQSELTTYKGVMVSKNNQEKDIFKINLLNMLQK